MQQQLWIRMANLIFETEKKVQQHQNPGNLLRNTDRMKAILDEAGLMMIDPTGEVFTETRTDIEASITSDAGGQLVISEVLKPAIYLHENNNRTLLQKAVVLVGKP